MRRNSMATSNALYRCHAAAAVVTILRAMMRYDDIIFAIRFSPLMPPAPPIRLSLRFRIRDTLYAVSMMIILCQMIPYFHTPTCLFCYAIT